MLELQGMQGTFAELSYGYQAREPMRVQRISQKERS